MGMGTYRVLSNLDAREREFYQEALKRSRKNVPWAEFEEFAFGMGSPLYTHRTSHIDVLGDPLYQALKRMCLDLGVKQGLIAVEKRKQSKTDVQRRSQSGSRQATNQRNSSENRKLAASDSLAGSHS